MPLPSEAMFVSHRKHPEVIYKVLNAECMAQVSSFPEDIKKAVEDLTWVAYQNYKDPNSTIFFRPLAEFNDGRFRVEGVFQNASAPEEDVPVALSPSDRYPHKTPEQIEETRKMLHGGGYRRTAEITKDGKPRRESHGFPQDANGNTIDPSEFGGMGGG